MVLEHINHECTGNWRLLGDRDGRSIACERCHQTYPATPEHRLEAIAENYAGIYLDRLAAEGAARLSGRGD